MFVSQCITKKGTTFIWGSEQQSAFENLKRKLTEHPIVQSYSLRKELTLTCDASEKCIAAVLSQEGLPVMYMSKTLTPAEQRYSNIESEALSIIYAAKRADKLLLGRHFTVKTDHQPLKFICGEKQGLSNTTSSRIQKVGNFTHGL